MLHRVLLAALITLTAAVAAVAELPDGAVVLDPDVVWDIDPDVIGEFPDPSAFAISPDDALIAYISKGVLWTCNVTKGEPTKLVDLPNTKTAYLARPEYRAAWTNVVEAGNSTDQHIFLGKLPKSMIRVFGLAWTPSQDGVVYTLGEYSQERPWKVVYRVMHVSVNGRETLLTMINRDSYDVPHHFKYFHVTKDRKYVIASTGYSPLIWNAADNKPRATYFDALVESTAGGRYLGVEIDTRQLVIADDNFKISKRFDVVFDVRRFCDLLWSPDELYAICRSHLEHPSDSWVGFRIDLRTGEQRHLEGASPSERWTFSGNGGEAIRIGRGARVTILPDGDGEEQVLRFRSADTLQRDYWYKAGRYPATRFSRNAELFAVALPRDKSNPGYRYHLTDRDRKLWPLMPVAATKRVSPYRVIAIANNGQTIVACNETRLFSMRVASIKRDREQDDD